MNMKTMPDYIKRELEELQKAAGPSLQKVSKYSIWTMPLLLVSVVNLGMLIFFIGVTREMIPALVLFALLGAIGAALLKEIKYYQKEINEKTSSYMIERIQNSSVANEYHKTTYIELIKKQPAAKTINYFIRFLMEEHDRKKLIG